MYNPKTQTIYDVLKLHMIGMETILEDELNQIRGTVFILDFSGCGYNHVTSITPQDAYWVGKNIEVVK